MTWRKRGTRCSRPAMRSTSASRSSRSAPSGRSTVASQPTCMCAVGVSTRRNEASSAVSLSIGPHRLPCPWLLGIGHRGGTPAANLLHRSSRRPRARTHNGPEPIAVMTIPTQLVERLRDVHASMVDAVLSGERMRDVAAIAARRIGRPVAVVIPDLGYDLVVPEDATETAVACEVVVRNGGAPIGAIRLLGDDPPEDLEEAQAVLHLAAMA